MVALVFLTMSGMIALDIVSKWRSAKKFERDDSKKSGEGANLNLDLL